VKLRTTRTRLLLALAAALLTAAPAEAAERWQRGRSAAALRRSSPQEAVSLDDFVSALEPLGGWYIHSKWGRAWRPREVESDWRPYRKGRWVHTQRGWYWVSDEPWGWATYHFGRWFVDPLAGWTWIPGREWATAWVVWREGKGLVGWAPLGPDGRHLSPNFQFMAASRLGEPVEGALLPPARSGEALMATRVLERASGPPPAPRAPPRRSSELPRLASE